MTPWMTGLAVRWGGDHVEDGLGVDGRGRVQLVRQLSSAACIEGRTWGQDARGVWVTDGCRGEFRSW